MAKSNKSKDKQGQQRKQDSDIPKFIELYTKVCKSKFKKKINPKIEKNTNKHSINISKYGGFLWYGVYYTEISFDENGKFLSRGFE